VIDALRCTECVGAEDEPQCKLVCPVEGCIIPNPDFSETREQLLAKIPRAAPDQGRHLSQGLPA
jgi:hypothetical protein